MGITIKAKPNETQIDIQQTTLVVVDIQNCTAADGGMWHLAGADVKQYRSIVEPVNQLARASRKNGRRVVYIQHCYSEDFREFGDPSSVLWVRSSAYSRYHDHPEWRDKSLIKGTWGAEILESVKPEANDIIVEKSRYSAFWGTQLDVILKSLESKYLLICGIMAHICVEATVRDAFYYGYHPIYVSDAVAAPNSEVAKATEHTLSIAYGWVTGSNEIFHAGF